MYILYLPWFLPERTLVFRQKYDGVNWFPANTLNVNENDPTADIYSIIGNLDNYKVDGKFYFHLCYPSKNSSPSYNK